MDAGPQVTVSLEQPPPAPTWYRLRYRARDESGFGRGGLWSVMHFPSIPARQQFQIVWGLDFEMAPIDGAPEPTTDAARIWE